MSVVALAGGVGAARFLEGLVQVVPPEELTVIVNTGDDMANFMGLYISPDVDIVTYTLAGIVDQEKGWGIEGDTFHALQALQKLGFDTWFSLGDQDLGTHLARTAMLQQGWSLSKATQAISELLGVRCRIIPMTEQWVPTRIVTDVGLIHFEEYLVKRKAQDAVEDVLFDGIDRTVPSPGVIDALEQAETIVVCPSNPIVSIGPILAVPGIKPGIMKADAVKVAVSPIVGGKPVKGPADKLMEGKGIEMSAVGVAQIYEEFLDIMVIDKEDQHLTPRIEELGMRVVIEQTLMTSLARKKKLAQTVLAAAREQKRKS